MNIISRFEPESCTWTYLVADTDSSVAAIIDPVWVYDVVSGAANTDFVDALLRIAAENGYQVKWVLETHVHADHLTAADYVRQQTGAKIAAGKGVCDVQKTVCRIFKLQHTATDGSQFDRLLADGDTIQLGELEIRAVETPGHTSDSMTYLVADAAFIGDTLFAPAQGSARCDFPGGDAGQLYDSIQRLYALPDNTRLFLCHDYPEQGDKAVDVVALTVSRNTNIHVRTETTREEFISMRTQRDAGLGLPRLIMPSLQVNIRAGAGPKEQANGVPYLLTPFNRSIAQILQGKPSEQEQ